MSKTSGACLNAMARFARVLAEADGLDQSEWAARDRYIRINGNGLRPVWLSDLNPCGAMDGYSTTAHVDRLRNAFGLSLPERTPPRKPEHRLQARIIRHALTAPDTLPSLLHLHGAFDAIRFVTDEFRVDERVRSDLLFLGLRGRVWAPIFIELKAKRHLGRLLDQLRNIVQTTSTAPAEFEAFIAAATGVNEPIICDKAHATLAIIWPKARSAPAAATIARIPNDVHVLEYDPEALDRGSLDFCLIHRVP